MRLVDQWDKIDEQRRKLKSEQLDKQIKEGAPPSDPVVDEEDEDDEDEKKKEAEEDEDKYADHADMPGQKLDMKTRTTIRNLRCVLS
jgi:pre-mRNA-processing factor SLU7